ncbi:MAG TPA: hypothetical protein VMT59_03480 [Gaiellaceae bacterium]|nr:hypothetical protein [Gaiellaceae bacterium]
MDWRGTPGLARATALPVGCLAAAGVAGVLAWTTSAYGRWLAIAAVSAAIFGLYRLAGALRLLARRRREADSWLRTATGGFVPPAYAWRAAQLCDPRERRSLARTLRLIEASAYERAFGWRVPLYLPAVREHGESIRALARALESLDEPVTPAGMLRVGDLVQDGGGPLWAATGGPALADEISATLALLRPGAPDATRDARAA